MPGSDAVFVYRMFKGRASHLMHMSVGLVVFSAVLAMLAAECVCHIPLMLLYDCTTPSRRNKKRNRRTATRVCMHAV